MNKDLTRRRILRGMVGGGAVTLGLPFLDCMLNTNGTALAGGRPLPVRFGTWNWGLHEGHQVGDESGQRGRARRRLELSARAAAAHADDGLGVVLMGQGGEGLRLVRG